MLIAGTRSKRGASFRLLDLIADPRWQLSLSPALLFEYAEVTRREANKLWLEPARIEDLLDFVCAQARKPRIDYLWRPFLPDPDDDMILDLAVAAGAHFIVTHNVDDFRGAERFGIRILTPCEFLRRLEELS